MKRLFISISIIIIIMSFCLSPSIAQQMPSKSIHQAAYEGDIDEIKLNIANGTDINEKNRMGYTPLHAAIMQKQQESIDYLLEQGADINVTGGEGKNALHLAVQNGMKELVEILIKKETDINVVDSRGDNALTLSRNNQHTEITELLLKNGATEPVIDEMDRYGMGGPRGRDRSGQQNPQPGGQNRFGIAGQQESEEFVLGDPNEIRERIKTFKNLDKKIEAEAAKSSSMVRQWRQTRSDNRSILIRSVQKQYESELGLVRTISTEEDANETVKAIDSLLSMRQERLKKITRELVLQRREQRQEEAAQTRGRTRSSGRSSRGRQTQNQQYGNSASDSVYGRGRSTTRTSRTEQEQEPEEQLDMQTQEEMDLWLDSNVDDKENLLVSVHEIIFNEIGSVRKTAEEEKAQQTVAAIDGLLLARLERFNGLTQQMEADRIKAQEREERNQAADGSTSGRRGRTGRGGTLDQRNSTNQQGQSRSQSRRR